jgi:hypothetical protein
MQARDWVVLAAVATLWPVPRLDADDWLGPRVATVFSEDGQHFVRVTPGRDLGDTHGFAGAGKGAAARAEFYERQPDRSYRLVADVHLLNPVAPVDMLLSDRGFLVTFDNWANLGYGKVVAVYDHHGRPVASWELEQLYDSSRLREITHSVSSRWWRCSPFHFVDLERQTQVYVREALGGDFVFDLPGGKFTYHGGSLACQAASRRQGIVFVTSTETKPPRLTVSFTNAGSTPLDDAAVERSCAYRIDGASVRRKVLFALSCLGGCPEILPDQTFTFEVPLDQLVVPRREGAEQRPLPGRHRVVVTCLGASSRPVSALFP